MRIALTIDRWYAPLDPDCPETERYVRTLLDDPMSEGAPTGEIMEAFEQRHRGECARCQEYGAANIEVA